MIALSCPVNRPSTCPDCYTPNAANAAPARNRGVDLLCRAVLGLRWFRQDTDIPALVRDHGISRTHRLPRQAITVLADQAPDLHNALQRAKDEGAVLRHPLTGTSSPLVAVANPERGRRIDHLIDTHATNSHPKIKLSALDEPCLRRSD